MLTSKHVTTAPTKRLYGCQGGETEKRSHSSRPGNQKRKSTLFVKGYLLHAVVPPRCSTTTVGHGCTRYIASLFDSQRGGESGGGVKVESMRFLKTKNDCSSCVLSFHRHHHRHRRPLFRCWHGRCRSRFQPKPQPGRVVVRNPQSQPLARETEGTTDRQTRVSRPPQSNTRIQPVRYHNPPYKQSFRNTQDRLACFSAARRDSQPNTEVYIYACT